jgi:hypothetical protein
VAKKSNRGNVPSSGSFTRDERELIVADLLALKKTLIGEFLSRHDIPKSGTKEEIRSRIEETLDEGTLALRGLVQFLDEVIPWGKQHVYLYSGPKASIADWRNADWLASRLKKHRMGKYLNASLPLVLPEKMSLSSILHDGGRLRVTAIKRRDWYERDPEYDQSTSTDDGEDVELRAYVHRVTRSLVAFEWDLTANNAMLQISQLPSRFDYAQVAEEFFKLIASWLDIEKFSLLDMRVPIKKLHEREEAGKGETRSHGINYRTLQGRRFEGKSASPSDPLLGDAVIDAALGAVRKSSVGHLGNFYWLPANGKDSNPNPLGAEVHVIIVGSKNRINFPTPNGEKAIRHVLSRIRIHCT